MNNKYHQILLGKGFIFSGKCACSPPAFEYRFAEVTIKCIPQHNTFNIVKCNMKIGSGILDNLENKLNELLPAV